MKTTGQVVHNQLPVIMFTTSLLYRYAFCLALIIPSLSRGQTIASTEQEAGGGANLKDDQSEPTTFAKQGRWVEQRRERERVTWRKKMKGTNSMPVSVV